MNEFLKLLIPWQKTPNDQISDVFVYLIVGFFIVCVIYFGIRIILRSRSISNLANKISQFERPAQPSILHQLKEEFDKAKFHEAWQEFSDSLITRQSDKNQESDENQKVVYKTDEASYFFSEDRLLRQYLNLRFWNSIPSILVGFGILGTFVGLVWGLIPFSNVDFQNTEEIKVAIKELLSGVSTAFVTSVWGMVASLLFNGIEKLAIGGVNSKIANLQRSLDKIFTLTVAQEIAFRQEDELAQQTAALKSFSTDLANDIKSAMAQGREEILRELNKTVEAFSTTILEQLRPILERLMVAIEELRQEKEESSTEAIKELIEKFQESMSATAVTQMEELAKTVGEASQSLKDLPEQIGDMIASVQEQIDQTRELLAATSQEQTTQMNSMMEEMLVVLQTGAKSAANQIKEQSDQQIENMKAVSDESIQALQTAIAALQQSITETVAKQQGAINQITSKTAQASTDATAQMENMTEKILVVLQTGAESAANQAKEQSDQQIKNMKAVSDESIQALQTAIADLQQSITETVAKQQDAINRTTSQVEQAATESTGRLTQTVQSAEESISKLLKQQDEQIKAFNAQIANSRDTLESGRELLEGMRASLSSVREIIEKTQSFSDQLIDGAELLENTGKQLMQASTAFNQENEKYLTVNRETIQQLESLHNQTLQLVDNSTQRFQTIDEGLQSIFEEIDRGLNTYAVSSRETINTYLSDFSGQLTEAAKALASSIEALEDNFEDLNDNMEQLFKNSAI